MLPGGRPEQAGGSGSGSGKGPAGHCAVDARGPHCGAASAWALHCEARLCGLHCGAASDRHLHCGVGLAHRGLHCGAPIRGLHCGAAHSHTTSTVGLATLAAPTVGPASAQLPLRGCRDRLPHGASTQRAGGGRGRAVTGRTTAGTGGRVSPIIFYISEFRCIFAKRRQTCCDGSELMRRFAILRDGSDYGRLGSPGAHRRLRDEGAGRRPRRSVRARAVTR